MESDFSILLQREIYNILMGEPKSLSSEDDSLCMPYYRGTDLQSLCTRFGFTNTTGGSRWTYMKELLEYTIKNETIVSLLQYLFEFARFKDRLRNEPNTEAAKAKYKAIVTVAVEKINKYLLYSDKKLVYYQNTFAILPSDAPTYIEPIHGKLINLDYIHSLHKRIAQDLDEGRYDNVLTSARTLTEEIIFYILEQNQHEVTKLPKGDFLKLQQLIKNELGIQQDKSFDNRINAMLSGLEKTIQAVIEMRNAQGSSHGVGTKRINIKKREAQLVANATVTYLDYIFSVYLEQNGLSTN